MINSGSVQLFVLLVALFVFSQPQAHAQQPGNFDDGLRIGASVNFGSTYFESDFSSVNNNWSGAVGYQAHVLYGYSLSPVFAVESGLQLFVNRYSFNEVRTQATNEQGDPTGDFFSSTMDGTVGTTYVSLPVNLIIRPLRNKSFYALLGPDIAFKVAYSNGEITTVFEAETDEGSEIVFQDTYDAPEQSNSSVLFVNAALGYSFDSLALPLSIELGAKQAVTPYIGGDDFINRWIRNASFTVSYRF